MGLIDNNKLKITAYKKNNFSGKVGDYILRLNPTKISHNLAVYYDTHQAFGSSGADSKYRYTTPDTLNFEFIFDNTIVSMDDDPDKYDVEKEIEKFKKLVFTYNGSIHRPNYLMLSWGNFIFKGQITNINFLYTAFNAEGKAMRAKADVTFIQVIDTKTRLAAENKSSPDMTHIHTIKEGDKLPALCEKIYGDPYLYVEIAQINKLNNFRNLKAGEQLILPPLVKSV